jgi:hypothetical protein
MTKTLLALSSVALAAALVGCGGNGQGGSGSASPTVDAQDQGIKYAQCMRKHGIQMEDPKPGGGISMRMKQGDESKLKAAETACKAFAPVRTGPGKNSAEDLDRMRKLAQCLRRNGLDVKDPKPNEPFQIKSTHKDEAKMKKAMQTCSTEVGMPTPGSGQGPQGGLSVRGGS